MADYSDKLTDKELIKLERKLTTEYRSCWSSLNVTCKSYFANLKDRYLKEYEAFQEGKYTKEQFDAWYLSQVGRGKRWEALQDDMAQRISKANQMACDYINDMTPKIYAENYNFSAYTIEGYAKRTAAGGTKMDVAFDLVDEHTIKELMLGKNHSEFKALANTLNLPRDYKWNYDRIQSALVHGILEGDSIDHLADRFMAVMENNRAAAIRNARTSVTSAQNSGRLNSYHDAEKMGIKLEKEWMSTSDARTRESHIELDGVRVGIDEEFPNGLRYPGDPKGEPAEVYNCRCTMRAVIAGYDNEKSHVTGKTMESYRKWKEGKK